MILVLLAGLLAAMPVVPARAATGGPDAFGYTFIDSNSTGGPAYNFQDISGTGTMLSLADDVVSGAVPIGFTFNYYGSPFTNAYISSNGFITMLAAQPNGCCSGVAFPNAADPDGVIAGWWEDLYPPAGGSIRYQTLGSSPARVFIVQYTNIQHYNGGTPVTFQIKLFETSNRIEVHYQSVPSDGGSHSAGIENATGSTGLSYYFGTGTFGTPLAVRYSPHGPIPTVDTFTVPATSNTLTIPITAFTASDDLAVTGYMITGSSTPPAAGAAGWTGTAPATYTVATDNTYILYPWAKDAAGNVSPLFASPRTVLVDTTAPLITITEPDTLPALSKTITASASDGTLTMSNTTGAVCNGTLTFAAYASQTFTSDANNGTRVCYRAVDALGNTGYSLSSAIAGIDTNAPLITITEPDTLPATSKTITASASDGTLTMSNTTGAVCDGTLTFAAYASQTFTSEADNGTRVCYRAVDTAGNTSYSLSAAISGIDTTSIDLVLSGGVLGEPGTLEIFDLQTYTTHFTQIVVTFNADANNPSGNTDPDDVTNPENYQLITTGPDGEFNSEGCGLISPDDSQIPTGPVAYTNTDGFAATVTVNGGIPLPSALIRPA